MSNFLNSFLAGQESFEINNNNKKMHLLLLETADATDMRNADQNAADNPINRGGDMIGKRSCDVVRWEFIDPDDGSGEINHVLHQNPGLVETLVQRVLPREDAWELFDERQRFSELIRCVRLREEEENAVFHGQSG